ncbi:hypothetical protein [uncultured Thermanaerothrix sp.]|uniref:hypothetical protein n=1 Tax=uncultured Thermanaerothrix sp. TaxID=1195149 RepID=UPI00261659E9|nr:hypothetical protein [uncultured Thermanaerothrix sp.]
MAHDIVKNYTLKLPSGAFRLRVLRLLIQYSKQWVQALGTELIESDWEKILQLDQGETQGHHAALVLLAAYQACLRGWKAEVVPFDLQATP